MAEERVSITIDGGIAEVTLTRADKLNAIDPAMFDAICAAIDRLEQEPGLRVVVLRGEGRGFCAGLDLASMAFSGDLDVTRATHGDANRFQQVAWGWRKLPVPVIAVLHGMALGGGLQIASGADIRIAAPDTKLSVMELAWGIVPDMAGFALWRGMVRDDVLREAVYTARVFDAAEGVAHGFVTRVSGDPNAEAMALARAIAGRNPHAVRAAKRLANLTADGEAAEILTAERVEQTALLRTSNQMEAVRANMEKRPPQFQD